MNNDQPPVIVSNTPAAPLPAPSRGVNFSLILIVVLGLGTVVFGLAAISASSKAHTATATLAAAKAQAANDAKKAQKAADDQANTLANATPYRTYTAPDAFGGFAISFPKDWSASVDEEETSGVQVSLTVNPNFVRRVNNVNDLVAARVELHTVPMAQFLQAYNAKTITQTSITVSGIAGTALTGTFPDKRTTRLVAVPVRDKTLVFINENGSYASTFDTILAQAKINP